MNKLEKGIIELKNYEPFYFSEENFNMRPDDERFNDFLDDVVLKYIDDKEAFKGMIWEKKYNNKGIFDTVIGPRCTISTRDNMQNEIDAIKIITRFVNYKENNNKFSYSIDESVVGTFNQYEYLYRINDGLSKLFLLHKKHQCINQLRNNDVLKRNSYIPEIYSYLLLLKKLNTYDINELNRINTKSKSITKSLNRKGYKLD